MNTELLGWIEEWYPEALLMDGYNNCIVGVTNHGCVVYDRDKVVAENMSHGMTEEEAEEYFSFNQEGAHMGEYTPVFMQTAATITESLEGIPVPKVVREEDPSKDPDYVAKKTPTEELLPKSALDSCRAMLILLLSNGANDEECKQELHQHYPTNVVAHAMKKLRDSVKKEEGNE